MLRSFISQKTATHKQSMANCGVTSADPQTRAQEIATWVKSTGFWQVGLLVRELESNPELLNMMVEDKETQRAPLFFVTTDIISHIFDDGKLDSYCDWHNFRHWLATWGIDNKLNFKLLTSEQFARFPDHLLPELKIERIAANATTLRATIS